MNSNLRLFREGILPVWEDPINIEGGKWNITLIFDWKKEAGSIPDRYIRLFLNLLIHLICGQLGYEDVLFGACLSVREYGLQISVWNKFSNDSEQIDTIKMRLADILKQNVEIKYYTHKSTLYYHQEITKTIEGGIKIENFEPKKMKRNRKNYNHNDKDNGESQENKNERNDQRNNNNNKNHSRSNDNNHNKDNNGRNMKRSNKNVNQNPPKYKLKEQPNDNKTEVENKNVKEKKTKVDQKKKEKKIEDKKKGRKE